MGQEYQVSPEVWQETGLPYIQNFSPGDYDGEIQNFAIAQDALGLMYFGNAAGVLVYDGVSWEVIPTTNKTLVRSFCLMQNRIYVGAQGEIGYLDTDAQGRVDYESILNRIPKENRDFKEVYELFAAGDSLYMRTHKYIFRISHQRTRVWTSPTRFEKAGLLNGTFYVVQHKVGLLQMAGDSLHLVPGSERFGEMDIREILSFDDNRTLIGTLEHGLFLYDGHEFTKFTTAADDFILRNQLRDIAKLSGGLFALATARGVVVLDKRGNLCQIVNKAAGLRDDLVLRLFKDLQGGLWLGLNNGIARVETPAPMTRFADAGGIESFVESIVRHNHTIYAATDRGVYYLDKQTTAFPRFKPVSGISSLCFALLNANESLLVGSQNGMFIIDGKKATRINRLQSKSLYRSKCDSNRVFVGLLGGLAVLRRVNHSWLTLGRIAGIEERIVAMTEDDRGALWLATLFEGVLKVEFEPKDAFVQPDEIVATVSRFGRKHGLPEGSVIPAAVKNRILFATTKGLRRFDVARQQFLPDSTCGSMFADTTCQITHLCEDVRGNVWFVATNRYGLLRGMQSLQPDGAYAWSDGPFRRMNDIGNLYFTYPESNGTVWFGGSEGIARYTPNVPKNYSIDYSTLIRKVRGISTDSVFYYGATRADLLNPRIEYRNNSLRFEFAAPSYDDVSANRYQVRLDGFDREWSGWTKETRKDYTGLPTGHYTFRVRARNVYGNESREGSFQFTILPPWYETWWAFLLYALAFGGLMTLIVKGRVRRLEKKALELEHVVAERTAQIVEQKNKIEEQAENLQELDQLKSRFFANLSHEFRTPLTLILGPVEDLLERTKQRKTRESLQRVHRSARRLQRLINQLLDLSRLESGKMKLQAAPGDFVGFLKGVVMAFASLAENKNIELKFEVAPSEPCEGSEFSQGFANMYFDRDKIEKIFSNLLSNALKFTPEGGEVTVAVAGEAHTATIDVFDSGLGITDDRLPHLFDRFFQVDGSATRAHEGTGIGLALVKELVELHHGEIAVKSRVGEGTTFKITLPLGKAHLHEDEIVSSTSDEDLAGFQNPPGLEIVEIASSPRTPDFDEEATVVLIVEDHADVRQYICSHLEPGYRVVEAKDGLEGLEMAKEVIPDLVISDVMMPKQDGYALCAALKTDEKTSHIPVILLTARAGEEDKLTGLETGADDYLLKPFNAKELQVRVRNLIEQRRKLRQRFIREGMMRPTEFTVTSVDDQFLQKVMATIEARMDDESFSVEELSQKMNMGPRHLHRKIRALTDKSPVQLVRFVRLFRARQLLEQGAGTVSEIAYRVGFSNLSYFARVFREEYGKLPSEI